MRHPRYLAGIDIGSTKVCTIIADVATDKDPRVLGFSWVPSEGLQRGAVVDLEAVGKSVAQAVDVAERTSGHKIESAYFGVADEHVRSFNRRGLITLGPRPKTIGASHVARAVEGTMGMDLLPGEEVLHFVPRAFRVDGDHVVQNPVGMRGRRLEVETHVVAGATSSVVNTMSAIHRHGLEIDELVVGPLAAAESVLTAEERQAGTMLLDVGGETTDVVIFTEGGITLTTVVGLGGAQVTSDLAIGLRTPLALAEEIKVKSGRCVATGIAPKELITVPTFDDSGAEQVPLRFVAEICEARMEEIFDAVIARVADSGFRAPLPGGVVLTGGGAALTGSADLARRRFELPARIGVPRGLRHGDAGLASPALAVGTGLVLWGMRNGHPEQRGRDEVGVTSAVRRLGRWLRHLMP